MTLLKIFWPPAVVLGLHFLRLWLLPNASEFDMLMHFLGGLSIAWVTANVYQLARKKNVVPALPRLFQVYFFIASAELVGVLWEFWEFYLQSPYIVDLHLTLADTESDLFLDLCGAIVFAVIWTAISRSPKKIH